MKTIKIILSVFQGGCFSVRHRSDNEFVEDIYRYIDNPYYESAKVDKENLINDFRNISTDLNKSIEECKLIAQ